MVEIKLQIYLLLAWKDCALGWSPWYDSNLFYQTHFSFSFSVLIGKFNQGNWNFTGLIFSFRSSCSSQVLPCGTVQVPLHLAGGTERTFSAVLSWQKWHCCTLPLGKCWCFVCTNQQGEKPVAAGGGPGSMVPGTGLLGCWKRSGGIRRGGRSKGI